MRNSGNNFGFFAPVPKDVLDLILMRLPPSAWANAGKVCFLWRQRAGQTKVREGVSRNAFVMLKEIIEASFTEISPFINKEELIRFLMDPNLPIALKINELMILSERLSSADTNRQYACGAEVFFKKTLALQKELDNNISTVNFNELANVVKMLALYLVKIFQITGASSTSELAAQFSEQIRGFYRDLNPDFPPNEADIQEMFTLILNEKKPSMFLAPGDFGAKVSEIKPAFVNAAKRGATYAVVEVCVGGGKFPGIAIFGAAVFALIGLILMFKEENKVASFALFGASGACLLAVLILAFCCRRRAAHNVDLVLNKPIDNDTVIETPDEKTYLLNFSRPKRNAVVIQESFSTDDFSIAGGFL